MQLLAAHRSGGSRRWTWCACPRYSSRARCPTSTAAVRVCIIPGDAGCCARRAVQWSRVLGRRLTLLWKRCLAKVVEVLEDPSNRGQVLKMTEATARAAHPGFVVAFLGASRMSLAASLLRVCSSGPQEVRDGEFDARGAHIGVDGRRYRGSQTNPDLHCAIGTCSDVRCNREAPLASTKLGLSEWRLLLTAGLVSHLLWDVSDNICAGHSARTWHMLVADGFCTLSQVDQNIVVLSSSASSSAQYVGLPLSWNKLAGGDLVSWVGFEEAHRSHLLGISTRRAEWFVRWTTGSRGAEHCEYDDVRRRHRKNYVRNGCTWTVNGPVIRTVPWYVSFYLQCLVLKCRHSKCAEELRPARLAPRVDALATAERTGIGGWLTEFRPDGTHMTNGGTYSRERGRGCSRFGAEAIARDVYPRILGGLDESQTFLRRAPHRPRRRGLSAEQTDDHELSLSRSTDSTGLYFQG